MAVVIVDCGFLFKYHPHALLDITSSLFLSHLFGIESLYFSVMNLSNISSDTFYKIGDMQAQVTLSRSIGGAN